MKISKRERILIYLLIVIAVVAGFVLLGLYPLSQDITAKRSELTEYQDAEMQIDSVLMSEPEIRNAAAEAAAARAAVEGGYARKKSYEIHNELTGLCAKYQAVVTNLSIGNYAPVMGEDNKQIAGGSTGLYVCNVTMSLSSDYVTLLNLENAVAEYADNMAVSAFAVRDIAGELPDKAATIQIDIYAVDIAAPTAE